jgi:hypothetical protein
MVEAGDWCACPNAFGAGWRSGVLMTIVPVVAISMVSIYVPVDHGRVCPAVESELETHDGAAGERPADFGEPCGREHGQRARE